MSYPIQCPRVYSNPAGNVVASGFYRSYITQDIANEFPNWMHLRQNPRSYGQQLISAAAINLEKVERSLEYNIKSKFLNTAPVDEVDVLYRVKLPSSIDLSNASASGIRCITATNDSSQIWINEVTNLEDFYYNLIPTRMEIASSGVFTNSIDGVPWNTKPSGVLDLESYKYDIWKNKHRLTWAYSGGQLRKQDYQTMEDYETYPVDTTYGTPVDLDYSKGMLWWLGKTGSNYYINLTSTKTQEPISTSLDFVASYNLTGQLDGLTPSGVIVDASGYVNLADYKHNRVFQIKPKYDYFILDKSTRTVYFRENYSSQGVFISNT